MTDQQTNVIFTVVVVAFIATIIVVTVVRGVRNYRWLTKARASNYDWYKSTYPDHVSGNRVSCLKCMGTRIHVRSLMRRTFLREHVCTQCGTALYYSAEDSVR
jgi:uncharacterized paraquat-inducible protein A